MKKGFTLIELLVAIAIIGILAGGVIVYLDPFAQLQKAHDARRKSDLSQIRIALEQHNKDNGSYPLSTAADAEKPYRIKGFRVDHLVIDWGEEWNPYMVSLPKDANPNKKYVYVTSGNGQSYRLYASLDRGGKDLDACKGINNACFGDGVVPMQTACGGVCNYGVSSTNISP